MSGMPFDVRYLLAWIPMVALAVGNGILRVTTYGRHMPELRAHQLSTLLGATVIGAYVWLAMRRLPPASPAQALQIGLAWVILTVAFEFLFGHFVAKHPWTRLLQDYDLRAGRVWVLFLLWLAVAPWIFRRW